MFRTYKKEDTTAKLGYRYRQMQRESLQKENLGQECSSPGRKIPKKRKANYGRLFFFILFQFKGFLKGVLVDITIEENDADVEENLRKADGIVSTLYFIQFVFF